MSALRTRLAAHIRATGPVSVHDYMAMCLFDPQHGYYMRREPFGREGDFTTAPEVSQMFGELIGAWLVAAWRQIGSPRQPVVAEIGPGRGTLMKDVARTLARLAPDLHDGASFRLIETSDRLAAAQAAALEGMPASFTWHKSVEDLPRRPVLIVGNELFDAIPMRQYVKTANGWRERCVGIGARGELVFMAGAGALDPGLLPADADSAAEGSVFEIAPARAALMQQIAERVAQDTGAGLFFDYGHLRPGLGDTLQAVSKHRYDHPLAHPGEADLTSHVDFAALGDQVRGAGLEPHATTQGAFLLRLGLLERAGALGARQDDALRERLAGEVERLAGRDAMGELFKVLGFASGHAPPPGFEPPAA